MKREIDCVLNFLVDLVKTNSDMKDSLKLLLCVFRCRLGSILTKKYEGHWFPDEPCKYQEYRTIRVSSPEFQHAVMTCGLMFNSLHLPSELTIWVDPGEVRYRLTGGSPISCIATFKEDEGTLYDVQDTSSPTHKNVDSANTIMYHLSENILNNWKRTNSLLQSFCKHLIRAHDHVKTIVADETIVYKFYMEKDKYDPELVAYFNNNVQTQLWKKLILLKILVFQARNELQILFEMIMDSLKEMISELSRTYSDNYDAIISGSERTFLVKELLQELVAFASIFLFSHERRAFYCESGFKCLTTRLPLTGWHLNKSYDEMPVYWGNSPALLAFKEVLDSYLQRKDLKFPQNKFLCGISLSSVK